MKRKRRFISPVAREVQVLLEEGLLVNTSFQAQVARSVEGTELTYEDFDVIENDWE